MALLVVAVVCVWGCTAKGPDRRGGGTVGNPDSAWRPEAEALRIYPSTRFIRENGTPMLEARVELFDQMGDSVKASGRLRFELFAGSSTPGVEAGRLLYSWDIDLLTLEDQQEHYDPITRAYLMRLRLDSTEITRSDVLLRVTLQRGNEDRLSDEQPVRIVW